jgi:diguanylate cyclase (GGDEF)-like protein
VTPMRTVRTRRRVVAGLSLGRPTLRPAQRIWLLTAGLASAAGLCWLVFGGQISGRAASAFPWPVLALGMYLAEIKVVNVHFRRETHSFSLSEIPAVIGLFVLSPADYVLAATLGPALAFVYPARQPLVKGAFNTADYALCATVSVVVFYLILPGGATGAPGPQAWIAAFAATLATTLISAVSIAAVITLSGGAPQFQKIPEMLHFGGLVALANTSIGLLGITVVAADPAGAWLLAVPVAAVYMAYRAYVSEREKKERLELLYHSSRILQHSPELDSALVALLDHAREMFRSERADCLLLPADGAGPAILTRSRVDEQPIVMRPDTDDPPDPLRERLLGRSDAFIYAPDQADSAVRQAMVAPLAGDRGPIGYLVVANRLGEASTYEADDLRLLETLAGQVAVALQNGQLEQSLSELSRLKDQLRHQAYHDSLTRLGNRALLTEAVERRLSSPSPDRMTAVLFLDLDDFKIVNDTLGHSVGDELLAAVADRIALCVRDGDVAARLGGDEFAVLVHDLPDLQGSLALANRLRDELRMPIQVQGHELAVDVSIGIAAATSPTVRADELLRNADVAMYTAKTDGKGRVAVFDPTIHAALVARHALGTDLTRGLLRSQFELYYQPIVLLADRRLVGFEALLRWHHPERGLVAPDDFIRIAEENGSIVTIGRWVLGEACRQAVAWTALPEAPGDLVVTVNVSPRQLQAPDFIDVVVAALDESGLPPEQLVIEVTETAMFQDASASTTKLEELRRRGVRVALDDFGTGYASLSHLRRFPVDILKIARDFVVEGDASGEDWAFAAAIIALARTLGLRVIAEGIEQGDQEARLRALGCEMGQGYHLGLPSAAVNVEASFASGCLLAS